MTVIICLTIILVLRYLIITRPLQEELKGYTFEYIYETQTSFVIPIQYQLENLDVPPDVINQMKNDFKTFLDTRVVENSYLSRRKYEAFCNMLDGQLNQEKEMIKSIDCIIIDYGKVKVEGDKAIVKITVKITENVRSTKSYYRLFTIGFINKNDQWKIVTEEFDFLNFEETP